MKRSRRWDNKWKLRRRVSKAARHKRARRRKRGSFLAWQISSDSDRVRVVRNLQTPKRARLKRKRQQRRPQGRKEVVRKQRPQLKNLPNRQRQNGRLSLRNRQQRSGERA